MRKRLLCGFLTLLLLLQVVPMETYAVENNPVQQVTEETESSVEPDTTEVPSTVEEETTEMTVVEEETTTTEETTVEEYQSNQFSLQFSNDGSHNFERLLELEEGDRKLVEQLLLGYVEEFSKLKDNKLDLEQSPFFTNVAITSILDKFDEYDNELKDFGLKLIDYKSTLEVKDISEENGIIIVSTSETIETNCTDDVENYEYDELFELEIYIDPINKTVEDIRYSIIPKEIIENTCNIMSLEENVANATAPPAIKPIPTLTGNKRQDAANIARSQIGYTEGYNNYNAYAPAIGTSNNLQWCAIFATWCAYTSGINKSNWPSSGYYRSTTASVKWFQDHSRWHNKVSYKWKYNGADTDGSIDNYAAQPGDFAAVENNGGWGGSPDHTAFVVGNDGTYVYTVEGNVGAGQVKEYKYYASSLKRVDYPKIYIVGFGEPDYGGGTAPTGYSLSVSKSVIYDSDQFSLTIKPYQNDISRYILVIEQPGGTSKMDVTQSVKANNGTVAFVLTGATPGTYKFGFEISNPYGTFIGTSANGGMVGLQKKNVSWGSVVNLGNEFTAAIQNMTSATMVTNNGSAVGCNYNDKNTQWWNFVRQTDGSYKIQSLADSKYLEVENGVQYAGAKIKVGSASNDNKQKWFIYSNGDGYNLRSAVSQSAVLDLDNASTANNSLLHIMTYSNHGAQRFKIIKRNELKSVSFNKSEINLKQGGKSTLNIVWNPSDSTDLMYYTWSSSDTNVAAISSSNGTATITAKDAGTSTITCKVTTVNGKVRTATCKVNVTSTLTGISLNKTSSTMYVGDTLGLNVNFIPAEAKNSELKNLKLTSSNTSVAVIDNEWIVSAVGAGKTTITATVGKYTAKCEVTVKEKPIYVTGIQLDKKSLSLKVGDTAYLNTSYLPKNANANIPTSTDYKWVSKDISVVTVENGKVTAKGVGKTTIVASYKDFQYSCDVAVAAKTSQLKGVTLEESNIEIAVGNSMTLTPMYSPSNVIPNEYKWTSSDDRVLSVNSQTGMIKALASGTATVTIEADGYKASCDVKVQLPVTDYLLSYVDENGNNVEPVTSLEMLSKDSIQLNVNYLPESATVNLPDDVCWTSSDNKIATVADGKVTALAVGEATIYADVTTSSKWDKNLEKRIACQITVKPSADSIQVGDNAYAEIEGDTLYIRGSGDMYDFTKESLPKYCSNTNIEKIFFDEGITRVGNYSFYEMENVKEIHFSDSITYIGMLACSCENVSEIKLPKELVEIGRGAFAGGYGFERSNLQSIEWNNKLKKIGRKAFKGTSLREVILPDTVESLGDGAFENCPYIVTYITSDSLTILDLPTLNTFIGNFVNLEKIYIGKETQNFGYYNKIFCNPYNTECVHDYYFYSEEITVNSENPYFIYRDGMLFKDNGKTLYWIAYSDAWQNGTIIIPEGVEKIECQIPGKHVILPSTLKELPMLEYRPPIFPYAESIEVNENNQNFKSLDGVLFSKDMKTLWAYPYEKKDDVYVIPKCVNYVFSDSGIGTPNIGTLIFDNQLTNVWDETGKAYGYCDLWPFRRNVYVIPDSEEQIMAPSNSVVFLNGQGTKVYDSNWYEQGEEPIIITNNEEIASQKNSEFLIIISLDDFIEDLIVSESEITLTNGETKSLKVQFEVNETLIPDFDAGSIPNAIWTSDNPSVATVNNGGQVKAVGVGVATLTASLGDVSKEVQVYVGQAEEKTTLIEDLRVTTIPDQTYTGSKVTPAISVYDGNTLLKLNKDYTVSYKNNVNVWNGDETKKPTVIVKGKGNYQGTEEVSFNIVKKSLLDDDITISDLQAVKPTGKRQKLKPVVYRNGKKLNLGEDYSLEWPDSAMGAYIVPGTYKVIISGINGYEGEIEKNIIISKAEQVLISKATVSKVNNQSYTGGEIKPSLTLTYKGRNLVEGTDYLVSYSNNVNVGKATAHIEGIGEFVGTRDVKFSIVGLSIEKANVSYEKTQRYTGTEIEPLVTVTLNGKLLNNGTDYTVSYKKNINKGSATILVKGINQYMGSISKTFNIVSTDISVAYEEGTLVIEDSIDAEYVNGGCTPDVNITYNGIKLVKGTDYTLSYKNNKVVSDENSDKVPQIIVRGKGNFKGIITTPFSIVVRDIGKGIKVTVNDVIFSNKSKAFFASPTLTDLNGKKLLKGKDFESNLEYTYATPTLLIDGTSKEEKEIVEKGDIPIVGSKIAVKITGKGNYTGTVFAYYYVAETSISKATIEVNPQSYTGKEIVLDEQDDFKTATYGKGINKISLILGEDFEIVQGSYERNISKGTASVKVKGLGNYGGTKQLNFKIKGKSLFW